MLMDIKYIAKGISNIPLAIIYIKEFTKKQYLYSIILIIV